MSAHARCWLPLDTELPHGSRRDARFEVLLFDRMRETHSCEHLASCEARPIEHVADGLVSNQSVRVQVRATTPIEGSGAVIGVPACPRRGSELWPSMQSDRCIKWHHCWDRCAVDPEMHAPTSILRLRPTGDHACGYIGTEQRRDGDGVICVAPRTDFIE